METQSQSSKVKVKQTVKQPCSEPEGQSVNTTRCCRPTYVAYVHTDRWRAGGADRPHLSQVKTVDDLSPVWRLFPLPVVKHTTWRHVQTLRHVSAIRRHVSGLPLCICSVHHMFTSEEISQRQVYCCCAAIFVLISLARRLHWRRACYHVANQMASSDGRSHRTNHFLS